MSTDLKNKLYFGASALVVIGIGIAGWYIFKEPPVPASVSGTAGVAQNGKSPDEVLGVESEEAIYDVALTIDYGGGERQDFTEKVDENTTAAGLLSKVALANNFEVGYQEYDFGRMITAINGKASDSGHFWGFYVNGEMAEVGADSYVLKMNDIVEFRFTQM